MHFYRAINPIKAITFDLDDTLYDNKPVIKRAEQELVNRLQQVKGLKDLTVTEFNQLKREILTVEPEVYHDVVAWRKATIRALLARQNLSSSDIESYMTDAINHFTHWRHEITVPQQTHRILTQLAKKLPLAVISNGNVDVTRIGMDNYFEFTLRGGVDGRAKPFSDTFEQAAKQLDVPLNQILHVGDNLQADVMGAVQSGMQACWINLTGKDIYQQIDARVLPHVEITDLAEIENLV